MGFKVNIRAFLEAVLRSPRRSASRESLGRALRLTENGANPS